MFPYGGYRNFLVATDVFSHKMFAKLLKTKSSKDTMIAMKEIFSEIGIPESVQADKGKLEFHSNTFSKILNLKLFY